MAASIVLIFLTSLFPQPASTADSGLITKPSDYSVSETIDRFENAIMARGQIVSVGYATSSAAVTLTG
jgi:hypothetical protein